MTGPIDVDELLARCRSRITREYFREAVDCYHVGAYRSCVIATWIALVYDIIEKLREIANFGDASAAAMVTQFESIQRARDTNEALKFERDILNVAQSKFELVSSQEHADLSRLQEDRNRFGHPNLNQDGLAYSATAELARLHMASAVSHVLSQPPVQGKAALESLQREVDTDYFPEDIDKAVRILKGTSAARAKRGLVEQFVLGALISCLRESLTPERFRQRLAAVQAMTRMHRDVVVALLASKIDGIIMRTAQEFYGHAVYALYLVVEARSGVKDAAWEKLATYVQALPQSHMDLIKYSAHIPELRDASRVRLKAANVEDLANAVEGLSEQPPSALAEACVSGYENARSFDVANYLAVRVIRPMVRFLDLMRAEEIVRAARNVEVRGSFEYPPLVRTLVGAKKISRERALEIAAEIGAANVVGPLEAGPIGIQV